MVKCPRCGTDIPKALKEWNYSVFRVKKFDCEKCERPFFAYFKREKLSHIIKK